MNDIYSYLNSKDVEEHCRSIGHKFNSLESCFIINDCYRISVQEKHRLFREIMETMPDSALSDRMTNDLGYSSFYAALKKTIEAEENYLELLKHGGSNLVYTYKYRDEKMNDYYTANAGLEDFSGAQGPVELTLTVGSQSVKVNVVYNENPTFGTDRTVTAYKYSGPSGG